MTAALDNSKTSSNSEVRCFRIPFQAETPSPATSPKSGVGSPGIWWIEFEGRYATRQMEVYTDGRPSVIRISGVCDMHMCEIPLEQTGLTLRKGAECLRSEFEREWALRGGDEMMRRHANQIGSARLRTMLAANAGQHAAQLRRN